MSIHALDNRKFCVRIISVPYILYIYAFGGVMAKKDRKERFITLAENRVNNALKYIRLIGNLSNKSNYIYSDKDVKGIFSALESEIKSAKARFEEVAKRQDSTFKL